MKFFNAVVLWLVCITGMQSQISVVPTVKHLTSTSTPNAGTITLNVSGGTSPYSYTWTPGPVYTKDINNKAKNAYVVKVKDNAATTVTYTYNIGYKADWDQMYGCISRNDSLINDGLFLWSQAITKNNLAASTNGFAEYILKGMGEIKVFGMVDSLSPVPGTYADIDYGYYYEGSTGILYEVRYGALYNGIGALPEGTALRIERSGSTIKFVVNGVTAHSVTDASAAAKVWKVKAMIWGDGAGRSLANMGCSFATKGGVTFKNYSNIVPYIAHSAAPVLTDGFIRVKPLKTGTYTYTWQPGSVVSATLSSKAAGQYSLSARDASTTITPKNYNIGYKVKWDQLYRCSVRNDTLIGYNYSQDSWESAITKNTLSAGSSGWFEYVLRDMDQYKVIGFTDSLSPDVNDIYDIDCGFYYEQGTLYRFGNGYFSPILHNTNEGTILRVERRGDTVEYKVNGAILSSEIIANIGMKDWKVKGVLYAGMSSTMINVGCSFYSEGNSNFPNYIRLTPTITHETAPGYNNGGVSVSPIQSGAYTYVWQPGSVTGAAVAVRPAGTNKVTVKDSQNHTNSLTYTIGYKVSWGPMSNCEQRGDTLITQNLYNFGRAVSKNTLAGGVDGWFEYVLKDLNQIKAIGFTDSLSFDPQNLNDIDYGFYYYDNTHSLYTIRNGSFYIAANIAAGQSPVLRVERRGDTIRYLIDGIVQITFIDAVAVSKAWKLKGNVLAYNNSSLINVGCSFYQQGYTEFPNYNTLTPSIVHASSVGANDGSIRVSNETTNPLSYLWQPGNVTGNPLVNIQAGNYKISVEDTLHHTNSNYYHVAYKTYWDSVYGATVSGDTLETTQTYSWGRALSKNTLAANTDGWFEYVLEDLGKIKIIGFVDSMSTDPQDIYDIDYGFNYDAVNGYLYTFYKGNYGLVGQGISGSVLRVERKADTILFSINGISLGSIVDTVDARKPWKIKGIVHAWAGTRLVNVGCSFPYDNTLTINPVITNYINDTIKGTASLNVTGGYKPYNIVWNHMRYPTGSQAYHLFVDSVSGMAIDSVSFIHDIDSMRQSTVFTGLSAGNYPVTIYDAMGDSLSATIIIGLDFDTLLMQGASVASNLTQQVVRDGKLYAYGPTKDLQLSGSVVAGENMAVFSDPVSFGDVSRVEFVVPDTGNLSLGFTPLQAVIPYGVNDIRSRVALSFHGSSYSVYVGNLERYIGSYQPGDVFSITNGQTGDIKFYKNNTEVWTANYLSIASPEDKFLVKAVLSGISARLKNIIIIRLPLPYGVTGTIKDGTCANPCSGTIDAVGRGKFLGAPIKYELYSNLNLTTPLSVINSFPSGNHALFTNLCPGKYTVKFYYTYQDLVIYGGTPVTSTGVLNGNFEVAYSPQWTNVTNVSISADKSLTKTGGALFGWDAGASTENFLKSTDNGWIEWTVPTAEGTNVAGFNNIDQSVNFNEIDYANYYHKFNGTAILRKFLTSQNGTPASPIYNYADGQKFRLEKQVAGSTTTIKLLLDGAFVTQFSGITATDYILDVSMQQMSGTMNNPRVSFGCGPSLTQYAVPKREADGGYYALDGVNLKFTLDGEYTLSTMKFKVLNRTRAIVLSDVANGSLLNAVTTKPGDNRYILDCSSLATGYYSLEVSNEKNEKLYLRFKR